jgi:hypothetical protein
VVPAAPLGVVPTAAPGAIVPEALGIVVLPDAEPVPPAAPTLVPLALPVAPVAAPWANVIGETADSANAKQIDHDFFMTRSLYRRRS